MATKEGARLSPLSHLFLRPVWKKSLLFYGICVLLDEVSTFSVLALGGKEVNPRLAFILEMNPLLWTLIDTALLLCFMVLLRTLKFKGLCLLPLGVGAGRLLCFLWNIIQIALWIRIN